MFSANLSGTDQWDPAAVQERTADGRPYLTIDRLSQPIYSLVNQQRESGAALQVQPVDGGADVETAEVYQGVIRNIENQSRAKLAYTWGYEGAVRMGRGFVRILPEFVSDRSFDQDLRIKRVLNPFSVYPDPTCQEPDYADANFYFAIEDLTVEEYQAAYGKDSEVSGLNDFASIGDQVPLWFPNGHVRVAEYYYIDHKDEKLLLFRDQEGKPLPVLESELEHLVAFLATKGQTLQGQHPEKERPVDLRQIKWVKINGVETLKSTDVPGRWIPIVPIVGEELFVDGQRDYRGIVRGAKEAAKVYNVQVTALIEAVGLIPKAPFVIAAGQMKGFEKFWRDSNVSTYAALPYHETSVDGHLVPAPQRNPAMPPIQALVAGVMQANNDVMAATRYFEASLGKEGPESSGVAIQARQRQGNTGTAHFESNFRDISLAHIGRILVDQIPTYYDTARMARIIGEDEQAKTVMLNQQFTDEQGVERRFDLSVGTYDVTVIAGPGFATKQQETKLLLSQTIQAAPQIFPLVGDLYMKALGLYDIAKRLEKGLPPELRDAKPGEAPPIPPEVKQQMDALTQEHEAMKVAFAEAQRKLATQEAKAQSDGQIAQLETASKERIAEGQLQQKAQETMRKLELEIEKLRAQTAQQQAEIALRADEPAQAQELLRLKGDLEALRQEAEHRHKIVLQLLKERGAKEVERHSVELHDAAAHAAEEQAHLHRKDERMLDATLTPTPAAPSGEKK
mgnify:FL=1